MIAPRSGVRAALLRGALGLVLVAAPSQAAAELVQKDHVRVSVTGKLSPTRLPRHGTAPIKVTIGGHITATKAGLLPQLQKVSFAFNRAGRLDFAGIPRCRLGKINPSTTQAALLACGSSLVGEGHFSADVKFPEQSPFPSDGKVLAFNGVLRGRPAIFAHIYGKEPVPTSFVLPLLVHRGKGTFATRLDASLPQATGDWGYVTGLRLRLGRVVTKRGRRHSFLSAGCPAPAGFPGAVFPLVRTTFAFEGATTLTTTLTRSCKARG